MCWRLSHGMGFLSSVGWRAIFSYHYIQECCLWKCFALYAKSFAYKYSGVIRPSMTVFTRRVYPMRLASPLIGGRGLHKRKRTLWHKLLSMKSKSVDSEPTRPPLLVAFIFLNNNHFPLSTSYRIVLRSELRILIHISLMTTTWTE